MKIALAQFNPTVGDFAGNSARILELAAQAKQRGADLAVFTELCLCGYPPQDLLERPSFVRRNRDELQKLAKALPMPSIVGYAAATKNGRGKGVANTAAFVRDGAVVFEQNKMLLPTYDVFDESRYFQPAEKQCTFAFGAENLGITISSHKGGAFQQILRRVAAQTKLGKHCQIRATLPSLRGQL